MIRRDYILRMIEEFMQVLSRIRSLKRGQLSREAVGLVDREFERLLGGGAAAAAKLNETELLARLIQGEPAQAVHEKTLMLVALFKEAGDLSTKHGNPEEGRSYYIKGIQLLLDVMAQDEPFRYPEFVPQVEAFVGALRDGELPLETHVRLMRHYEHVGEFAKAEDCLFSIADAAQRTPGLLELGMGFYHRLEGQSDDKLVAGNLPRSELESGLAEFCLKVGAEQSAKRKR